MTSWSREANAPALLVMAAAAILLWVLNDHIGKPFWGGPVTGKLSDVAGLIAFPVVLCWTLQVLGLRANGRLLAWACLATVLVFSATNIWQPAMATYESVVGPMTMDATDLLATPAAVLPLIVHHVSASAVA